MNEAFAIVGDEHDPRTVLVTGRVSRVCQAALADALAQAACHGRGRLDLTGLDALHVAAVEVLCVLAAEVDLEVVVRPGRIARAVHGVGLDRLATVQEPAAVLAEPA